MTAWNDWPPTATTDIQAYSFQIQAREAVYERFQALGALQWPQSAPAWDQGAITDAALVEDSTDITLAVPTTAAMLSAVEHFSTPRFVNYTCTGSPTQCCGTRYMPSTYDLIIQVTPLDPLTTIRCRITAEVDGATVGDAGTFTVDGTNILNAIAANFIGGLGDLAGAPYTIIRSGGSTWADRWPDKPNDNEKWLGTCTSSTGPLPTDTSDEPTQYTILTETDPLTAWSTDQWVAGDTLNDGPFEVLAFDGDLLKRLTIIHNDGHNLYVTYDADLSLTGTYSIVAPGAKGIPGRKTWRPLQWYLGNADTNLSHDANDTLTGAHVPALTATVRDGNPCDPGGECDDFEDGIFDIDYQVALQNLCDGRAGEWLNTELNKSLRRLQQVILFDLAPNFVRAQSYAGATAINNFTIASVLDAAGFNSGASSALWNGTAYTFEVDSAYAGKSIYYAVFDKVDGSVKTSGVGTADSAGVVTIGDGLNHNSGDDPNDDDAPITYSAGPTRYRPRCFMYHYAQTEFMPDTGADPDTGAAIVYDPPSVAVPPDSVDGHYDCGGKGTWITKPASTGGVITSVGLRLDSAEPFVEGELYRCVGDNWRDPFPVGYKPGDTTAHALLLPYWDRFYRGKLSPTNEAQRTASKSGTIAAGTKSSITQNDHHWYEDWSSSGGLLRTETFVATGGSATTFEDSTKDTTDPTLPHGCWYSPERWATGADPYVGFVMEIDKPHSGSDLTIDASDDKKVTSDTYSFTPNDVNMKLTVSSGTGWTAGDYTITAIDSGVATLGTSPIPAGAPDQATWSMTTTFKRPVTATTNGAGGVVVTFPALDGLTVETGDVGRIGEPRYQLNKWAAREVVIIAADGTRSDPIVITHSDDSSLFFADQAAAIPAGGTFQIIERGYGGVWKWDGTKMVVPGPHDIARLSVTTPADFKADQTCNNESWVKDYGVIEFDDMITPTLFKQIYDLINLLLWTKYDWGWVTRYLPDTEELNYAHLVGSGAIYDGNSNYFVAQDDKDIAASDGSGVTAWPIFTEDDWNLAYTHPNDIESGTGPGIREYLFQSTDAQFGPDYSENNVPPQRRFGISGGIGVAHYWSDFETERAWLHVGASNMHIDNSIASYAYGKATGLRTVIPSTLDMYVYATIDQFDNPAGKSTIEDHSDDGEITAAWIEQEYTFDPGGSGALYRQFALYASVDVPDSGVIVGPKFGETDDFSSLQGTIVDAGGGVLNCVSNFPSTFSIPQQYEAFKPDLSRDPGTNYFFAKSEFKGYVITKTVGIQKWQFKYVAP